MEDFRIAYDPTLSADTMLHIVNIVQRCGVLRLAIADCNPTVSKLRSLSNYMEKENVKVVNIFVEFHWLISQVERLRIISLAAYLTRPQTTNAKIYSQPHRFSVSNREIGVSFRFFYKE